MMKWLVVFSLKSRDDAFCEDAWVAAPTLDGALEAARKWPDADTRVILGVNL